MESDASRRTGGEEQEGAATATANERKRLLFRRQGMW
jgi:hypothetical protein